LGKGNEQGSESITVSERERVEENGDDANAGSESSVETIHWIHCHGYDDLDYDY